MVCQFIMVDIPSNIRDLLQLGNGFSFPSTDERSILLMYIVEYIKQIENNISHHNEEERLALRNLAARILRNYPYAHPDFAL